MKKYLILIVIFIITISCEQKSDCSTIPQTFTSYSQAEKIIHSADFKFTDNADTSKSSWIRGASFYSCNGKTGYFEIETDRKTYIYKDLPIEMWYEFKGSTSFGKYYNRYIKGRYRLSIE